MAILEGKTNSIDYEMLLSGQNGFGLKRYWRVWNLETLKNCQINWEVEMVPIGISNKVLAVSYHKID